MQIRNPFLSFYGTGFVNEKQIDKYVIQFDGNNVQFSWKKKKQIFFFFFCKEIEYFYLNEKQR